MGEVRCCDTLHLICCYARKIVQSQAKANNTSVDTQRALLSGPHSMPEALVVSADAPARLTKVQSCETTTKRDSMHTEFEHPKHSYP